VTQPHHSSKTRLGIYVDDVYRVDQRGLISSDRAFLLFACEVGSGFEALVLFGRALSSATPADYVLPAGVTLVRLPFYSDVKRTREVIRAAAGTARAMWRGLSRTDVVWVFGPHPFGFALIVLALLRRRRVVLGVRQDTVEYARNRMTRSGRWSPRLLAVEALDLAHRLLARWLPVTVVGSEIAKSYREDPAATLVMTPSLVPASAVGSRSVARTRDRPIELLTVGRLEAEKNPLLVVDALAEAERRRPARYRLTWIGRGSLEDAVRARAAELGVDGLLDLHGYVPFGDQLLGLYRRADVFLHVSRTEGVPQVLIEALACGTPIVATDVGGVESALDRGGAGLLVPRDDVAALVDAIERLTDDAALRRRLVHRGLELASGRTLEAESGRVARFIAAAA
jgi:glycosyltransferase involved in cell wall biosynthesis